MAFVSHPHSGFHNKLKDLNSRLRENHPQVSNAQELQAL